MTAVHLDKLGNVYFVNVGDSRAVLCDMQRTVIAQTADHSMTSAMEKLRLKLCGYSSYPYGVMTRAFGNMYRKNLFPGFLTAMPDVAGPYEGKGKVLVIASDGVWDVMSSKEAADIVADCFDKKTGLLGSKNERHITCEGNDQSACMFAARQLCQRALDKNSCDNVTAMVVHVSAGALS